MTKTINPIDLVGSGTTLATYYTANHTMFHRGPVGEHIVRIEPGFYGDMDTAITAIGSAFESCDEELQKTIAMSGLKEWVASLSPVVGGSIDDRQNNRRYLVPADGKGLKRLCGPDHWQCMAQSFGPYHDFLYNRLSRFDFGAAVVHIMTNTELQDSYRQFGWPADPRLVLVQSVRQSLLLQRSSVQSTSLLHDGESRVS